MTKSDIVERVAECCGFTKKDAIDMVDSYGEDIKISGFGKFEVKTKRARKGRNPQTGESIVIEARRILTFKPSTILKSTINSQ